MARLLGVLFLLGLCEFVSAGQLSGVTLPDTITVDDGTLVLNGMGQRKKMWVEVYVAGLYLPSRTSEAGEILEADAPWRLVMHFLHKKVDKDKLDGAWNDGFKNNSPDLLTTHAEDIDRFLACFPDIVKGQEVILTFSPAAGLQVDVAGETKDTFTSRGFAQGVLSIWLGPKPPSADLRKGLLGIQ
ncbi:chalcone isomerase family protein [Candidatus Fermentibacteria bacterium]|nr:chalcone isomerase family protein [Candidatus Fermentibacteria bacterium]